MNLYDIGPVAQRYSLFGIGRDKPTSLIWGVTQLHC
jgi:hypothetical protein